MTGKEGFLIRVRSPGWRAFAALTKRFLDSTRNDGKGDWEGKNGLAA
jgi:hypothetical protein